jgi:hypothetical protein
VVLAEGRVAGEVRGDAMTQANVLSLCYADRSNRLGASASA